MDWMWPVEGKGCNALGWLGQQHQICVEKDPHENGKHALEGVPLKRGIRTLMTSIGRKCYYLQTRAARQGCRVTK